MGHHHHHHGHGSTHGPAQGKVQSFNRIFAIAIFMTLSFTIIEIIYGFLSNSMSLLADAIHNLGDVLGLALAWGANWLLTLPARQRYSYGFKRTTIIASLINAFILIATSVLIAYESVYKLFHLTAVEEHIVIWVGLIGIFVNAFASFLFMSGAKSDLNIKGAFWHLLADAIILAGVVVSAIIIRYTKLEWIDPVIGLVIVAIILWGTWGLLRDSLHLILDAVPRYIDYAGVKAYLQSYPGVSEIHDLHIWGLSTREIALTVHLIMPKKTMSDADYKKINAVLHDEFNISHATLQIEQGNSQDPCVRMNSC